MINKETYLGIFFGTCLTIAMLFFFDRILTPDHQTPLQINYRPPLPTDTRSFRFENFNPSKSILSQIPSRLDPLLDCYAQMSAQELQEEIQKIDNEYGCNPAGTTRDAIAILFLAYRWGALDTEAASAYGKSSYLANNKLFLSADLSALVIHAWASKSPEQACKFIKERRIETRKLEKRNGNYNNFISCEIYPILGTFMGKYSPDSAYQWATSIGEVDDLYENYSEMAEINSILSIAWNHPDRLPRIKDSSSGAIYDAALIWLERDQEKALQWIAKFSPVEQNYIQNALIEKNATQNFESTVEYYNSIDDAVKSLFKQNITVILKEKNIGKALQWLIDNTNQEEFNYLSQLLYPTTTQEAKALLHTLSRNRSNDKTLKLRNSMIEFWHFQINFNEMIVLTQLRDNSQEINEKNFTTAMNSWNQRGRNMNEIKDWINTSDCSSEQKSQFNSLVSKFSSKKEAKE